MTFPVKWLCLSLSLLTAPPAGAAPLGRLFFTPEQRHQLEQQSSSAHTPPRLSGIVQKHGGPRTAWLNGQPQPVPTEADSSRQRLSTPGQPDRHLTVGEHSR